MYGEIHRGVIGGLRPRIAGGAMAVGDIIDLDAALPAAEETPVGASEQMVPRIIAGVGAVGVQHGVLERIVADEAQIARRIPGQLGLDAITRLAAGILIGGAGG